MDFCRVLYQYNAFVVSDEFCQYIRERSLTAPRSSTDEDVLALHHEFLQLFCEVRGDSSSFNEVIHPKFVGIELSYCQGDTLNAARWNYGGNTAAIRQAGVKDGLRF